MITLDFEKISLAQKWLNIARWAASGGNAQPWFVEVDEKKECITIKLSIDKTYAVEPSAVDAEGSAAALALGCFFFNLRAAASLDCYTVSEQNFDVQNNFWNCAITIVFIYDAKTKSLYSAADILNRKTDRYPYKNEPVPDSLLQEIQKIFSNYKMLTYCDFVAEKKKKIIKHLAVLEKIRWQNKMFFLSLLAEVSFGKEEKTVKNKIPASQLGAPYASVLFLRILRRFPKLGILFHMGFHRVPVKEALVNFKDHSDRVGFVTAKSYNFRNCFELGMCFQEIWLAANRVGVSFQPLGLPLIALGYWHNRDFFHFSRKEMENIQALTEELQQNFSINIKNLTLGFRLGWPLKKSKRTERREVPGVPMKRSSENVYASTY